MSKTKYRWLGRRMSAPGPYLTLCLSEDEYLHAAKHLKLTARSPWIKSPQADATAHHIANGNNLACIVCLQVDTGRNAIEIAGLLVHEAVHVWQEWCDFYGEEFPSREQEAYAVQAISQELLAEYARRISG